MAATADPARVPFGLDSQQKWVELRFADIENPHILIVGGSQVGKSSLQILIAAVAASRGNIVLILDPKLRFSRAFRHPQTREHLPNVLVYRDADPDVAAREWQGILELVTAEMQARYRADEQAVCDILKDRRRFPTVLVVIDELGTLLDFADKEWPYRKPDGYKGDTPIREMLHTLHRMGAEANVIGCSANQTASEKELPAGTRTRLLCGQRVFLGPVKEGPQWRMLAGEGVPMPKIPERQKGAGAIIYGDANPWRFQAGFVDWKKRPEDVYRLASRGISILRESGHIDDQGRLLLAGVPVPSPGRMASHVAGPRLDLLRTESLDFESYEVKAYADVQTISEMATTVPATPTPVMIVGNQEGADFCGLSLANFRKLRELYPIPNQHDKYQGNKPAWSETDLREWKLRHGERPERNKGKGAA